MKKDLIIPSKIMINEELDFLSKGLLSFIQSSIIDAQPVIDYDYIANLFGITKKTLKTKLLNLQDKGYIHIYNNKITITEEIFSNPFGNYFQDEDIDMFSPIAQKLAEIELLKLNTK